MTAPVTEADVVTIAGTTVSAPPQRSAGTYFPSLDGYRAIAAISILVFHVVGTLGRGSGQWYSPYLRPFGSYGVGLFFLLSGFLLYRPFALAYLRGASPPLLRSYYIRRLLRIFPGYWVALAALFFVFGQATTGPHDGGALWSYFSLTQIYHNGFQWTLGGLYVAWTLCIEVSFYIVLPMIAFVIRTVGAAATTLGSRLRVQLGALGTMYVLTVAWRIVNLHYPALATQRGWIEGYLDYFAVGMTLAVISSWLELGGRMPTVLGWLVRWPAVSLFFAGELYFLEMRLGNPTFKDVFTTSQRIGQPFLFAASAAFFLLPGIFGPAREGVWRRLLASRVMTLLGLVSFGIYLWHPIWLEAIRRLIAKGQFDGGFIPVFSAVFVLSVSTATLSYLLIEAPAMRFGRRLERWLKPTAGPERGAAERRPTPTAKAAK